MNRFIAGLTITLLPILAGCEKKSTADALGRKLSVVLKTDQVIEPGDTDDVLVTVSRKDLVGPVEIVFSNLPTGVSLTNPGSIPTGDVMHTYHLSATSTAPRVEDHRVIVTATLSGVEVRDGFNLTVRPKN